MHHSSVNPPPQNVQLLNKKVTSFQHPRYVARPYSFFPNLHEEQQQELPIQTVKIEETSPASEFATLHDEEESDIDEVDEASFIDRMVQECRFLSPGQFLKRITPASFKRWKKYNESAYVLDDQFNENKENIFKAKLKVLLEELAAAERGTHNELKTHVNALEQQRLRELKKIKIIEDLKTDSVNIRYEHECRAVLEGLEIEKRNIQNAWKSLINENKSPANLPPAEDDSHSRKRRKKDRSLTVGDILRDKIGMVNAVAKRRLAIDRMKEADKLTNTIQSRNEAELDGDVLAIRKKIAETAHGPVDGSNQQSIAHSSPR